MTKTDVTAKQGETGALPTEPYQPTDKDRATADQYFSRCEKQPPLARMRLSQDENGVVTVGYEHANEDLGELEWMNGLATTSGSFLNGILKQLINASQNRNGIDESGFNFMASGIRGINPQDQIETMLAAQMAAVHVASMDLARKLATADTTQQQDSAERAFNKLTRTFATQMQTLKRYRTSGEQKVTVEHVTVNEGGQAIVGNVAGGGGANKKTGTTS